jgi:uncharacterized membrane protein YjjP (DUF1212 family)
MAVVRMDDGARDLFRDYAAEQGVSVSALLEAIARRVHRGRVDMDEAVSEARAIDAERRSRDR